MVRRSLFVLCFFFVFVTFVPGSSYATWFDDFSNNMNISRPAHLTNQERGYYSLGGISYRTPTKRVPILTITPPSLQLGCGGIDAFWGGLSYLSPDYLIQMFQNIMQAAPAFAFKIALKVLCEQCDSAMTALTDLAQQINSMQMDECGLMRGAAEWAGDKIANLVGHRIHAGAATRFLESLNQHIQNFNTELQNFYNSGNFCQQGTAECNRKKNLNWPAGSLWIKILNDGRIQGLTRSETDVLRGLVGDIWFVPPTNNTAGTVIYVEPCTDSTIGSVIKSMTTTDPNDATMPAKTWNDGANRPADQCSAQAIQSLQFGVIARNMLSSISSKVMGDKTQALTAQESDFLSKQIFPIYKILNDYTLYPSWTPQGQIPDMDALVALSSTSSAYYVMRGIIGEAQRIVADYTAKMEREGKEINGIPDKKWNEVTSRFFTRARQVLGALNDAYRNQVAEMLKAMEVIVKYRTLERELKTALETSSMLSAYNF
ncbi:MAG: hypothetical protein DRP24_04340 [Thermotoga sp.]|nr:MAG: hypothetical protein DRP24_04340 [Thermotoga sp.]